jgi:putative transposase
MSFVRAKEIPPGSGNWYDYEVACIWEDGKPRQKHIQYLGKHGGTLKPLIGDAGLKGLAEHRLSTHTTTPDTATPTPAPVTPMADPTRIPKMKTPARLIASALGMYYGGMSLDGIEQQFRQDHDMEMSESNYWNWVTRFTKEAMRKARSFKPTVGDYWIADETYMKLKHKNVYFWDIIDSDSKFLLATHVSTSRSAKDAKALMDKARSVAGKTPKSVTTDKLKSYIMGVEDAYGADTRHRAGGPFEFKDTGHSTAEIERLHKTLEQRTEVFQKYKSIEDIRLLTGGWLINYNFMKQNEGCGNIPPAQAMSKIVPFKDWNDIVRDSRLPDIDYRVTLHKRPTVKRGAPVVDATLTPIQANGGSNK